MTRDDALWRVARRRGRRGAPGLAEQARGRAGSGDVDVSIVAGGRRRCALTRYLAAHILDQLVYC
jgi:hypothetical protein